MKLIFYHRPLLFGMALVMAGWFFAMNFYHNNRFNDVSAHAPLAYSVYAFNRFVPARVAVTTVDNKYEFLVPQNPQDITFSTPPIQDTIGYGVLLGLLWKVTRSFSLRDMQWLQVLLFPLSLLLIYATLLLLLESSWAAFFASAFQLAFLPLLFINGLATRDVWAYYGVVLLLYGLITFYAGSVSWPVLVACTIGAALCQWIRPTLFACVLFLPVMMLFYALLHERGSLKKIALAACIVWGVNLASFWVPFCSYNKAVYGRYCVGPRGQALLEGLGEFSNPWGAQLHDGWFADRPIVNTAYACGSQEFDDEAYEEFFSHVKERPFLFFMNMVRRLPSVLLPAPSWRICVPEISCRQKLALISSQPWVIFALIADHIALRMLVLLGYLGMFMAWRRRNFLALYTLVCGTIVGGWSLLPSHIEYRYLIPYYWPFALFAGYALYAMYTRFAGGSMREQDTVHAGKEIA